MPDPLDAVKALAGRAALAALLLLWVGCREKPAADGADARLARAARGDGSLSDVEVRAALHSELPRRRIQGLAYCRTHPVPGAVEELENVARGTSALEARFAVEALLVVGAPLALAPLSRVPPPDDVSLRRRVLRELVRNVGPSLQSGLFVYLSDKDPEVRQGAALALATLAQDDGASSPRILSRAREVVAADDLGPRLAALSVIASYPIGTVRRDLERALLSGPPALAEVAADHLAREGAAAGLADRLSPGTAARGRIAQVLARAGQLGALAPYRTDPDPLVGLSANYGRDSAAAPARLCLLIVIDTLRADRLSAYGSARPASRFLDRLSRRADLYEVARAQAPWTLASHVALFSSRYASELGVRDVGDTPPSDALFLPEMMRRSGFITAAVTSVPYLSAAYGLDRGFDWLECETNQRAESVTRKAVPLLRGFRALCEKAPAPRGLFLFLHYFDPHETYDPPAEWRWAFDPSFTGRYDPMKREGLTAPELEELQAAYDGEVAHADEEIGKLLAWIDRLGYRDRAIYLMSDHGEEILDHGKFGHGWTLYEEQERVPLLVARSGSKGALHGDPVDLVDVCPSVLSAAGLTVPDGLRGRPLGSRDGEHASYAESGFKAASLSALVVGEHKVILRRKGAELYDLAADPRESRDLGPAEPRALALARERLARETPAAREMAEPPPPALGPEAIESLRALGYLK